MKFNTSTLIKALQAMQEKHGDLPVCVVLRVPDGLPYMLRVLDLVVGESTPILPTRLQIEGVNDAL